VALLTNVLVVQQRVCWCFMFVCWACELFLLSMLRHLAKLFQPHGICLFLYQQDYNSYRYRLEAFRVNWAMVLESCCQNHGQKMQQSTIKKRPPSEYR